MWADLIHAQPNDKPTGQSIEALLETKARRTPAQRKLSSQFLEAAGGGQPSGGGARWQIDADVRDEQIRTAELVTVDIRADVTPTVLARIQTLGGTVLSSVAKYRAIRARLPLIALEPLAKLEAVQSIRPADQAITNQAQGSGSKVNTTEGEVAHKADLARQTYSVDGTGIGIGVLSNGVDSLAARQASGDLPARVTVLPGQAGKGDEGTAMLEIVHDLAPGAELYFAQGMDGQAQFAANIEALCEAGADVIVDDIVYFLESAFQDDIIARGVNAAVANGCVYFSSAGNAGNLTNDTSGVWEGNYVQGAEVRDEDDVLLGHTHDFGDDVDENTLTETGLGLVLQWADPLEASANDYDLFLLNEDGTVYTSSTTTQDGTQDPIEFIRSSFFGQPFDYDGKRLAIVKKVGAAARYLRLDTIRGRLAVATAGSTFGHNAAENAIGVGMVDVHTAAGTGDVFNGTESVHRVSSDGPRRIFFEPDGTPITPGNFSSTGGELLQKPDLSAASCVSTATPGFETFCGTSSAAPHAAAIAALVLEASGGPDTVTLAALHTAMAGAALDIEAEGVDRDSGAGIVMAPGAVDAVDVAVADRNRAPVGGTVTDRTLAQGANPMTLDLTSVFSDPDTDDTLTYTVLSSHPFVAVNLSGTTLTLTPVAPQRAVVGIRATDPDGLSALGDLRSRGQRRQPRLRH